MYEYECFHDDFGEKWIPKRYIAKTPGKAKYQHAQYLHDELSYGDGIFIMLKSMRYRKIGEAHVGVYFKDNDTFQNVRKSRGIEFAYLGMKVEVNGKVGVIVGGNQSLNLDVLFYYGTKDQYIGNCHPWWKMKYFDINGNVIREYKD
jgi:hypothetical protein